LCCFLLVGSDIIIGQNISVSETEFSQTLTVPDTGSESFTISNSGTSDLTYTITGQAESFASPLNILLFNYNPTNDFSTQLTMDNLLSILNEELPSAIITETDTEDPSVLASLLGGKGVFLVPRVRGADPAIFTGFAPVLEDYTNGGGDVVFLGTDQFGGSTVENVVFNSGLFEGTIDGFLIDPENENLILSAPAHPIVANVSSDLVGAATTYFYSISNDNAERIVSYDTGANLFDLVTTRTVGSGRAVLLGFTYFNSNEDLTQILVNTLRFTGLANENLWLSVSPESGTVGPGEDASVELTFDASLIPAGNYTVELVIEHNDGSQAPIILTCNLSTNGVAAISVPASVEFGNVVQTTTKSISVEVFNPGADTLFVSNVSLSGNFPITVSTTSFYVFPTLSVPITLTYSPTEVESFLVNLTIENNVETQVVPVSGNGTGAPTINISDSDIVYDIQSGNVESTTITLTNDGLGDLEYDLDLILNSGLLLEANVSEFSSGGIVQITDVNTGDIVFELPFQPGETIDATITSLASSGNFELEIINDPPGPYGAAFLDMLTLTDQITGNELIDEGFVGIDQVFPFSGATPNWLSASPLNGIVAFVNGGSNSGDVELVFDANGLIEGVYNAQLVVNPNEPLSPQTVNITLNVTGVAAVSVDQTTLDFGPVLDGLTNTLTIEVSNPGTAPLEVTNISFGSANYVASMAGGFVVQPFQSVFVDVLFAPDMEGNFDSTMLLETSAGDVMVNVLGEGIGAPAASVSPSFIEFFVTSGEMVDSSFAVLNQGEGPLLFTPGSGTDNTGFQLSITAGPGGTSVFYFFDVVAGPGVGVNDVIDILAGETAIVNVEGFDSNSTYSLSFFENTGSVAEFVATDLGTGVVVASAEGIGTFDLGSPSFLSWLLVDEEALELDFPSGSMIVPFSVDATGLSSGDFMNTINVVSNDPVNPIVAVEILMHVSAFPSAQIGSNTTLQCGEAGVQFINQSLNIPTSFFWDFGDGTTSEEQNPFHTYLVGGVYDVSLVACNTLGCDTLELAEYITADLACQAVSVQDATEQVVQACNGFVYDSGGPDGPYFNNSFGSVTIAPPGASSVTLSFSEFDFEEPFDGIQIFDGSDLSSPLLGEFTGSALPPDITSSGGAITIVENSDANVGLDGFVAIFSCAAPAIAPSAAFNIATTSTCSGLLEATDMSANFPSSWAWDFGDGETSSAPNPDHQYVESGTYTVSLEVCNNSGCDTFSEDITLDVLFPQVTAPFGTIGVNEAIQFQDNTEDATLWVWDFGDGNQSVGQNPVHSYDTAGIFELVVTIQNTGIADCSVVFEQNIFVDVPNGIEDGELFSLNLYPNPADDQFLIDLTLDKEASTKLVLYDLYGRQVYTDSFRTSELKEHINVADFPNGIYSLVLDIDGEKLVKRIMVAR